MIELNSLPKIITPKKKRLGRGAGSGRGKTAGRGTKGQKAKESIPKTLGLGGKSFLRRLPLYRGKFRNKPRGSKPLAVNIKYLNILPANSVVDLNFLVDHHIVEADLAKKCGVKILGEGNLDRALTVKLHCSKGAAQKIKAAGGKIDYKQTNNNKKVKKRENG